MMPISILVLEDNPSIREGYKKLLIREANDEFSTEVYVETFPDSDSAIIRLLDLGKPSFDLFFTDIDLAGSPNPNKAGIDFAKFARKTSPDVPIIGCSGYFSDTDLASSEKALFDKWWPKGSTFVNIDEMFKDAISKALDHRQNIIVKHPSLSESFMTNNP